MEQIKGGVNYKESARKKLDFFISLEDATNDYVVFDKDNILISHEHNETIDYNHIEAVTLSLCSRIYNPGVIGSHIGDIAVKGLKRGAPFVVGPAHMIYSMDMDIYTKDGMKAFESYTLHRCLDIIRIFKEHHIQVNDSLGIEDMLVTYHDDVKRQKYLDQNFAKMAKENQLDNPRGTFMIS